jgi:hypothetical protein
MWDGVRSAGCPPTQICLIVAGSAVPLPPWHWATRWVLERAQLSGTEVVCDLGAGENPTERDRGTGYSFLAFK